jgi:hypothetical protein
MGSWFFPALMLAIFVVPLIILFGYSVYDVLRRHDIGVALKALLIVVFAVVPIIGPLVYLVIHPPGATASEEALAAGGKSKADELVALADLHDRGKLSDQEFDHVKSQHVYDAHGVPGSVREQRGGQLL